jgi:hypothetical protein
MTHGSVIIVVVAFLALLLLPIIAQWLFPIGD